MIQVLPAYAGMIPVGTLTKKLYYSAPRVCGDDPIVPVFAGGFGRCSPRMRG